MKMFHGQISPRKRPFDQASATQVESKKTKFEEPIRTRRGPWTADEDELLTNLVKKFGTKKWALIAELVPGRVGKQCRERYLNHLRTDVKKTAWTEEEDMTLVRAQQELGNRWSAIARLLPGRPENSVKNRWNSLCNKRKRWSGSGDYDDSDGSTSADEQSGDNSGNEGSMPGVNQQRLEPRIVGGHVVGSNDIHPVPYDVISDRGPSPQVSYCADPNAFIWSLYSHRQQQQQQQQQQQAPQMYLTQAKPILGEVRTPTVVSQTMSLPKMDQRCFLQVNKTMPPQSVSDRSPSASHESAPTEEKRDSASGLMLLATLCT